MTVPSESVSRIECQLDDDPRLIAGARVMVTHVARRGGLSDSSVEQIADAAGDACAAVFGALRQSPTRAAALRVTAAEFPDRLEVTLQPVLKSQATHAPALPLTLGPEFADDIHQKLKHAAVDGMDVGLQDGVFRVTLVKYCSTAKGRFVV